MKKKDSNCNPKSLSGVKTYVIKSKFTNTLSDYKKDDGKDYPGNDIHAFLTTDEESCAVACKANSSCKAFTFDKKNPLYNSGMNCYLKTSSGTPFAKESLTSYKI